ncbi:MAG: argininosuccinate synthase [Pseudomonadota bacterium]|nr:argininosuccinate synthase [Pseudomonadota bacterium]
MTKTKIVLAYSGGLDTSVAIKWLQDRYNYDVIAVTADVGEGKDLDEIKAKALQVGAVQSHVLDVKQEFADGYLAKALKANALYEGVYPLISALSRPLIAKILVEIAEEEGAIAVAHGCTGKGNDQVRFDVSIKTLDPNLTVVAPAREFPMSREDAIQYAMENNIPLPINLANPYSIDLNLWGRSCECGVLEDPWLEPPEDAYAWTAPVSATPDAAEVIELTFEQGLPTKLNGRKAPFQHLIAELNVIAGKHGVGRIDHVENRLIGIKSREVYEAPAAMTLIKAHQALESLCLTRDVAHFKAMMEQKFANLVYEGLWYSPLFDAVNAFIDTTQTTVNGVVRMKLHKGNATVIGRQSAQSLYQHDLATYKSSDQFDHKASEGFIKIWGLPSEVNAIVNKKQG